MKLPRVSIILAPHTDDAEMGCGATMARLAESGCCVHLVTLSLARESLPPNSQPDRLRIEQTNAFSQLDNPLGSLHIYDYPVRRFDSYRQDILETFVLLRKKFQPDMVFLPAATDMHQDHQIVSNEGIRAFKHSTILGYELPWNQLSSFHNATISVEAHHLEKKWQMLQQFKSQFELQRPYFSKPLLESLARIRGLQSGAEFAESFETITLRW